MRPKQFALAVVDPLSDVVLPLGLGHVVGHLDRPLSPLPDGLILFDDVAHYLTFLAWPVAGEVEMLVGVRTHGGRGH